jgi:hypothetical protein
VCVCVCLCVRAGFHIHSARALVGRHLQNAFLAYLCDMVRGACVCLYVQGVAYTVPGRWQEDMCKLPKSKDVQWRNVTDPGTGSWQLEVFGVKSTEWAFQCPVSSAASRILLCVVLWCCV